MAGAKPLSVRGVSQRDDHQAVLLYSEADCSAASRSTTVQDGMRVKGAEIMGHWGGVIVYHCCDGRRQ